VTAPPTLKLVVLATGVAVALAWIGDVTEARIEVNRERSARAELVELTGVPALADVDARIPAGDDVALCAAGLEPVRLLRTRARGYGGDIELVLAIDATAMLRGVRVTAHQETPGIGDAIEAGKSDWVHRFDGLPADVTRRPWTDTGAPVDAITGATITSRAVVDAVRATLAAHGGPPSCRI
jgi:Na+-translocating ferredoxin:NAD+ oxidoreductase RnfG subunit